MVFILKSETELGRKQTNYYIGINGTDATETKKKNGKNGTPSKVSSVETGQAYVAEQLRVVRGNRTNWI